MAFTSAANRLSLGNVRPLSGVFRSAQLDATRCGPRVCHSHLKAAQVRRVACLVGSGSIVYGTYKIANGDVNVGAVAACGDVLPFLSVANCESAGGVRVFDYITVANDEEDDDEETFFERNQSVILTSGTVMIAYLSQEYLGGAIGFLVGCVWGGAVGVIYGINLGVGLTLTSLDEASSHDEDGPDS